MRKAIAKICRAGQNDFQLVNGYDLFAKGVSSKICTCPPILSIATGRGRAGQSLVPHPTSKSDGNPVLAGRGKNGVLWGGAGWGSLLSFSMWGGASIHGGDGDGGDSGGDDDAEVEVQEVVDCPTQLTSFVPSDLYI